MFMDRSIRTAFIAIVGTAAVILGVNLLVNPAGMPDNGGLLLLILIGIALALLAWNWREAYAEANPKEEADFDEADYATPVLPSVSAPALQPAAAAPAVTLAPEPVIESVPVAVVPDPIVPPTPEPEPVPAPVEPPAPEPETPAIPEPETPAVPEPVEPEVPAPAPADIPEPVPAPGLTDLADAEQKASAPEPEAPQTIEDAKNGEPVAEKVVADAMAAPEQPDAAEAEAPEPEVQVVAVEPEVIVTAPVEAVAEAAEAPVITEAVAEAPAAQPAAPVSAAKLDFTAIEGIGNYYNEALKAVGYTSFAQLAEANHEAILQQLLDAGYRRHPSIPTWPEQAGYIAREDWDGLKTLQDSLIGGRRA